MRDKLVLAAALALFFTGLAGATDPSLVAWWAFDEGDGGIAHDSAGSNDGTIYGASWTTGQIDDALAFDGLNDYVEILNNESQQILTNQLTLSAWVKLEHDIGATQRRIICKQQTNPIAWGLEIGGKGYAGLSGNQIVFHDSSGTADYKCISQTYLNINQWYHIGVTDNAGSIRIYLNGELDTASDAGLGIPSSIIAPIRIGRTNPESAFYFDGVIDEVQMYNRALSAEEIRQLYIPEPATVAFLVLGAALLRKKFGDK